MAPIPSATSPPSSSPSRPLPLASLPSPTATLPPPALPPSSSMLPPFPASSPPPTSSPSPFPPPLSSDHRLLTSPSPCPCSFGGGGRGSSCLYQVFYDDGSYTIRDFMMETVTLGDSAPIAGVAIGCGHNNEGLFVGAAGLLALGGGPLSFPSQISARSFSYCLIDRNSSRSSTLELSGTAASNPTERCYPSRRRRSRWTRARSAG